MIPEHLGVEMGVRVDEAGGDDVPVGVDLAPAPFVDRAHGDDASAHDGDVGHHGRRSGTVDDDPVPDDQIDRHVASTSDRCGGRTVLR